MLFFNIKRVLTLRGIDNHYNFLLRKGFVHQTAKSWLAGDARSIRPNQIATLCIALNCTPNDLFEWRPTQNIQLSDNHPLKALEHNDSNVRFTSLFREVPLEKLGELSQFVEDLKQ